MHLACARRRADEPGVASKKRVSNLGSLRGNWKCQPPDVPTNAFQERLAGSDHSPPEDHHVGVDGVHGVCRAYGQVESCIFNHALRQCVAGRSGIEDLFGANLALVGEQSS